MGAPMQLTFLKPFIQTDEIETASGRALVEERYAAIQRQVPVIYLLALVTFGSLQVTTGSGLAIGFNVPTALALCAVIRSIQWLRSSADVPHRVMQRRMRQTTWVALVICTATSVWCLHLLETAPGNTHMSIVLFGGLTALGVAYGLSALPWAACIPLLVLALPLAAISFVSPNPLFVGAALSLSVVALLVLRLLVTHNAQFTDLVRSRSVVSRQRRVAEQAQRRALIAATTDFLTGLPNRRAFVSTLDSLAADDGEQCFAVATLDLDRFKVLNDTLGHCFGDEVLKAVANRLVDAADSHAVVARLGGDEFGILFPKVESQAEAMRLAAAILEKVNRPAVVDGRPIMIRVSCGVAISRSGRERTPSRAMADADMAMYEAKAQPSLLALFEPQMEAPRRRRAEIEQALQLPGVQENFRLMFQPIVNLLSGEVVAQEALARWHDDELGNIPPSEFVPIAEQLNVIGSISEHLMAQAFREAARWQGAVRLSFNLSAVELCSGDLAARILKRMSKAGLSADRLQVEVTETALLLDFERARVALQELRSAGVTIVLDDFGAGYASIGYLREIEFDQIKLDGALVTAAVQSVNGERLLGAVVDLCRALGVATVAEHVESEAQRLLLLKLGCQFGQGYWLQAPQTAQASRGQERVEVAIPLQRSVSRKRSAA